jgi:hypothetical protein
MGYGTRDALRNEQEGIVITAERVSRRERSFEKFSGHGIMV